MTQVRLEHDLLGGRDVPVNVYYGVHTVRAVENIAITGVRRNADLIAALPAVDTTFVQSYPTLLPKIAQKKGTLSANYLKEVSAEEPSCKH